MLTTGVRKKSFLSLLIFAISLISIFFDAEITDATQLRPYPIYEIAAEVSEVIKTKETPSSPSLSFPTELEYYLVKLKILEILPSAQQMDSQENLEFKEVAENQGIILDVQEYEILPIRKGQKIVAKTQFREYDWFKGYFLFEINILEEATGLPAKGEVEIERDYYSSGRLRSVVYYKNGKKDGMAKEYYESGQLMRVTPYKEGNKEGWQRSYWENGNLMAEICYKRNKREGVAKEYDILGTLINKIRYKNDKPVDRRPSSAGTLLE